MEKGVRKGFFLEGTIVGFFVDANANGAYARLVTSEVGGSNPGKVPGPTFSIFSLARSTKEEDEQRRKCPTVLVLLDCYYLLRRFRCVFSRNQGRGFKNAVG